MSALASAATKPTRLPTTPAVGRGVPATGGIAGSGGRSGGMRETAPAGLPHGSTAVVSSTAGADHVLFAGAVGATHASFSGAGAGGDHVDGVGVDAAGVPHGSSVERDA